MRTGYISESARRDERRADELPELLAGDTSNSHLTPANINAQDTARDFLAQFAPLRRSLISNQFCFAVRGGCSNVGSILRWVREDAYRRLRQRHIDLEVREALHTLIASLDTPEAANFARLVLEREQLPLSEREKLKAQRSEKYAREWMTTQPPTEKQIQFLCALGCRATPNNKLEASNWIELYKRRSQRVLQPPIVIMQGDLFERGGTRA